MRCTKCDGPTRVVETRSPSSPAGTLTGPLIHGVRAAVGWYTSDWIARRRECLRCGERAYTVEVLVADLEYMQTEGKPPPS